MQAWLVVAAVASCLVALVALVGTFVVQSRATARIEGGIAAELKGNTERIGKIEIEQDQQWSEINRQGRDIASLKTKTHHL